VIQSKRNYSVCHYSGDERVDLDPFLDTMFVVGDGRRGTGILICACGW